MCAYVSGVCIEYVEKRFRARFGVCKIDVFVYVYHREQRDTQEDTEREGGREGGREGDREGEREGGRERESSVSWRESPSCAV